MQKTKIMVSCPITSWQIAGEIMETVTDFIFLDSKIIVDGNYSHEIKRCLLLGRKAMTKLVQFSSVAQSCPTLCDPMNCSTPGLPVYSQLLEFTQTHVHGVGDAIQPSHPLNEIKCVYWGLSRMPETLSTIHQCVIITQVRRPGLFS